MNNINNIKNYDLCIIGGGPAGLSAALYASRSGYRVGIIEKLAAGGQVNTAGEIANYPGFKKISGWELSALMLEQALESGAELLNLTAIKIIPKSGGAVVECDGENIHCRALLLSMGAASKTLGIEGEKELVGAGVSYCATCDGAFFKGKDVMVAGGGKAALTDVKYLSPLAKTVYWIHSGVIKDTDGIAANVIKLENSAVVALEGNPLSSVKVSGGGEVKNISVNGLFVAVGYSPANYLAQGIVELDNKGYIITDENMRTSEDGIFAAGDIISKDFRQIVTAASDGAIAAHYIGKYLKNPKIKF